MRARQNSAKKKLHGPTVQYADGTVIAGGPLDTEAILTAFERLNADARSPFLCVFAHDLTVAVRALLFDRPVPEADLDRVWKINEFMHQLTSCANPLRNWSPHDEILMLRAIVNSSFSYGLDRWVGHALATAAGNVLSANKPVAAT